jgi:hypothetical protein
MAANTSARVNTALGVGQLRATNKANVGLDKGMLKGYADKVVHIEHKRLTTAGTLSGKRRPYFFINPLSDEEKPAIRPNRRGSLAKLRKLEKRGLWLTGLVAAIASGYRSLCRFRLFKSYEDQVRCSTRQKISQRQSISQRRQKVLKATQSNNVLDFRPL